MELYSYRDDKLFIHHSIDKNPNPNDFPMHVHHTCEMFHFISGKGYYTVEGNDYELIPGCILLLRDAETHKLHIDPMYPYERFVVHFSPESIAKNDPAIHSLLYDRGLGQGNMITLNDTSLAFVTECFGRIHRAIMQNSTQHEIIANFAPVLYELMHVHNDIVEENTEHKSNSEMLVSDIITYINQNLTEIKNMDVIVQNFYFSRSYLNKTFKKSTGSTIWDYIIVKRLMKARILIQSGVPAASAAVNCGFSDYSSFYRQYKNRFGVSPSSEK